MPSLDQKIDLHTLPANRSHPAFGLHTLRLRLQSRLTVIAPSRRARNFLISVLIALVLILAGSPDLLPVLAQKQGAVVHLVMFWEEGCPACEQVRSETLPALKEQYGAQLEIELIEVVTLVDIERLYQLGAAYGLPKDTVGVPFVVIGETALVGSQQIPAQLPGLVADYLAAGGVTTVLREPSALFAPLAAKGDEPVWSGMPLAWVLMIFMLAALGWVGWKIWRAFDSAHSPAQIPVWIDLSIPFLSLVGLFVAMYLTYVESSAAQAICGPVGDCNAVQNSKYAYLFGVIPVGLVGAAGYIAILIAWLWKRFRRDRLAEYAPLAILGMSAFGVLFSIYLTYLEIFVILAVCIWCLSSALIITLLLLASLPEAVNWLAPTEEVET
jgi:uncharacterized membrane protein